MPPAPLDGPAGIFAPDCIASALNDLGLEADANVRVLDLSVDFTQPHGSFRDEAYAEDHVHLSEADYEPLTNLLTPVTDGVLGREQRGRAFPRCRSAVADVTPSWTARTDGTAREMRQQPRPSRRGPSHRRGPADHLKGDPPTVTHPRNLWQMHNHSPLATAAPLLAALVLVAPTGGASAAYDEYLAGYLIIPYADQVDRSFNAGYSMYVAAWPLLRTYPGHSFQSGLPGTWMFAQYDGSPPKDLYSDVEGGLGWWRDTRFPTETPKFIMGGVGPNFSEVANGPAHGWGEWDKPKGLYGVAQLSPRLLFPIDGLNIRQGECGGLVGYGYLSLPLCEAKPTTEGHTVPTGNQCWTLFLNTRNFKGPVAFFTPHFWSHAALAEPRLAGQLLDTRPAEPNRAVQMETQLIPCRIAKDSKGEPYARIEPTSFPRAADGRSALVHRDTAYSRKALWDAVEAWFSGGKPASGAIDPQGAFTRTFSGEGYATWQIYVPGPDGAERKVPLAWDAFATPAAPTPQTHGYEWNYTLATRTGTKAGPLVTLPEYYHLENGDDEKKARWVPVTPDQVPAETKLQETNWKRRAEAEQEPYTTPDDPESCWKKPGPVAGPFEARLGDGSVVTYYWYRFADQPALLNADLTPAERERMQARIEKLHRAWPKDRDYLPPPSIGKLAELDPAQIIRPPRGLEVGYVPIATRQEMADH